MSEKLTGKQRRFCELIAEGKTQADAYREAYDSTGTSQTVRNSASKLMQKDYIKSTVNELIKRKADINLARTVSSQELVTRTLRDHITGTISLEPTQVQSLSILAKVSGMYVNKIEDVTERSSIDIESELKRKLSELALVTDDDSDIDVSGVTH